MSYQGFEQWLCKNGHYHCYDCYDLPNLSTWRCTICQKKVAWINMVDTTNGSYDDFIDEEKEKILNEKEIDYIQNSDGSRVWNIYVSDVDECFYGFNKKDKYPIKLWKAERIDGHVTLKPKFFDFGVVPTYKIPKNVGRKLKGDK